VSGGWTVNGIVKMALLLNMLMALVPGTRMASCIANLALLVNTPMALVCGT